MPVNAFQRPHLQQCVAAGVTEFGQQRSHHLMQQGHRHAIIADLVGEQRLVGAQRIDEIGDLLARQQLRRVAT